MKKRLNQLEETEKVCPFMSSYSIVWNNTYVICIQEKCAIWFKDIAQCSLEKE